MDRSGDQRERKRAREKVEQGIRYLIFEVPRYVIAERSG